MATLQELLNSPMGDDTVAGLMQLWIQSVPRDWEGTPTQPFASWLQAQRDNAWTQAHQGGLDSVQFTNAGAVGEPVMAFNPATQQPEVVYEAARTGVSEGGAPTVDASKYYFGEDRPADAVTAPWQGRDDSMGLETLSAILNDPANQFFAATTGLGGMTLANAATGGDVQSGAQQDALTLASTIAGQYLAGQGAFAPEVANSGMDFGGQGVGWNAETMGGFNGAAPSVAQSFPVSEKPTLAQLMQPAEAPYVPTLADAGITQTYTPSDPFLVNQSTAETPWLSNAPEGSVMAAESATPTINAIAPDGGGLNAIINAPMAVGGQDPAATVPGSGGGASTATKAAAAGTAGGIGATKVSDVLSGNVNPLDNLTLGNLGTLGATAASVYGANEAANNYRAMYDQYLGLGAPSRTRYEQSFAPGFDITQDPALKAAMDTSYQSLLRGLSTQGNPYGNPGGLAEAQKYVMGNVALPYLQNYRNQNAATGGFGAFSTAAPGTGAAAVNAGSEVYTDLGRGIGRMMNPQPTLEDYFRQMSGAGARSLT